MGMHQPGGEMMKTFQNFDYKNEGSKIRLLSDENYQDNDVE